MRDAPGLWRLAAGLAPVPAQGNPALRVASHVDLLRPSENSEGPRSFLGTLSVVTLNGVSGPCLVAPLPREALLTSGTYCGITT